MAVVVDASIVVAYLGGGEQGERARERLGEERWNLWAPHLLDVEVGHVLRRGVQAGEVAPRAAQAALEDLADLPLQRVCHRGLLDRAWVVRRNLSFYDAMYVALAERIGAPLLTLDARMARAPGLRASIEVLS
jgi:predicted nucleic acid-binding protein